MWKKKLQNSTHLNSSLLWSNEPKAEQQEYSSLSHDLRNQIKPRKFGFRSELDPPKLSKNERGLIISSPLEVKDEGVRKKGELDLQELRFALLFWDRLDFPENSIIGLGEENPEVQFLKGEKILQRSFVGLNGHGTLEEFLRAAHVETFRRLDAEQPGCWSVGRGVNSISFDERELETDRGLLFDLFKAIPIPDREVPLDDILDFKLKHKAELLALRCELEDVFQSIKSAPDKALAEGTEFIKLELAISNQITAMKAANLSTRLGSLTVRIDLAEIVKGAVPAVAGYSQGLGLVGAALTGVASVGINFGVGLKGRAPSGPFEYVGKIHEQVF